MADAIQAEDKLAGFSEDLGDDDSFYGFDIQYANSLNDSDLDISDFEVDESAEEATSEVSDDDQDEPWTDQLSDFAVPIFASQDRDSFACTG